MAQIPVWLTGKYVTAYVITGQTVAADGTLTDAATDGVQPLAGIWEEIDFDSDPQHEEISAADSSRQHNVIIQESSRIRMTVIMERSLRAGAGANDKANPLAWIATGFAFFKVVFARGGQTWTCYFTRGAYNEAPRKGKCISTLSGVACDPGQINPAYAPTV